MKVFCGHCLDKREYKTEKIRVTKMAKGIEFTYYKTIAICNSCGHDVYVQEIEEQNLEEYQNAYCRAIGIVEWSIIKKIPAMYNIGIRPLSKMLGWGEITYTRYYEGFLPTKHYSNEILKIYNNPKYFIRKLKAGKNNISKCAYRKAMEAAKKIIAENERVEIFKMTPRIHTTLTSNNSNADQELTPLHIDLEFQYRYMGQAA